MPCFHPTEEPDSVAGTHLCRLEHVGSIKYGRYNRCSSIAVELLLGLRIYDMMKKGGLLFAVQLGNKFLTWTVLRLYQPEKMGI